MYGFEVYRNHKQLKMLNGLQEMKNKDAVFVSESLDDGDDDNDDDDEPPGDVGRMDFAGNESAEQTATAIITEEQAIEEAKDAVGHASDVAGAISGLATEIRGVGSSLNRFVRGHKSKAVSPEGKDDAATDAKMSAQQVVGAAGDRVKSAVGFLNSAGGNAEAAAAVSDAADGAPKLFGSTQVRQWAVDRLETWLPKLGLEISAVVPPLALPGSEPVLQITRVWPTYFVLEEPSLHELALAKERCALRALSRLWGGHGSTCR